MHTLDELTATIRRRSAEMPGGRAMLAGISGIDGAGKGYLAGRLHARLAQGGLRVATLNVDGWLNLPEVRFSPVRPGEHFYRHALRLDDMFSQLVLPLSRAREIRLVAPYAAETAVAYRDQLYEYRDVDVVLVEGIFILKRAYRSHFDLAAWIDCSFETALGRALLRAQEGLSPAETRKAYETIYFPAQRLHQELDAPRSGADGIIPNDPRLGVPLARSG